MTAAGETPRHFHSPNHNHLVRTKHLPGSSVLANEAVGRPQGEALNASMLADGLSLSLQL